MESFFKGVGSTEKSSPKGAKNQSSSIIPSLYRWIRRVISADERSSSLIFPHLLIENTALSTWFFNCSSIIYRAKKTGSAVTEPAVYHFFPQFLSNDGLQA